MKAPFNVDWLRTRVENLAPSGRLAFLLSCAERLFPNYVAFSRHHDWGESEVLRQALDLGWKRLAGERVTRGEIEDCLARCERVTPNTEDFDSEFVSAGLDAAICCTLVLELLVNDNPKKIVEAASLARDTVDMHVQELERLDANDPHLEEQIVAHPLMQRELERQRTDLDLLGAMDWTQADAVRELSRRWRSPAVSNIGLPRAK